MLKFVRWLARKNPIIRHIIGHILPTTGFFDAVFIRWRLSSHWRERIDLVKKCPDNNKIERVPGAGEVRHGKQKLHNGMEINVGSYYGPQLTVMLYENKGVHEPQEELIFSQVVDYLKSKRRPEYRIIELGSFWAFYSGWFVSSLPNSKAFMVEPEAFNIESGRRNFRLNGLDGTFVNAFVNDSHDPNRDGAVRNVSVDGLVTELDIDWTTILHSDIQGFEDQMLDGAIEFLNKKAAEFLFISTHSDEVHTACKKKIEKFGYHVLADINLHQTFSDDGLLFACREESDFLLSHAPSLKL